MRFSFIDSVQAIGYSRRLNSQSNDDLHKNFLHSNWQNLSDAKREKVLQEIENRNAKNQNRDACNVVISDKLKSNTVGEYNRENQKITLNSLDSGRSMAMLDTIYHEGQHAHQHHCIEQKNDPTGRYDQKSLNLLEVEFKKNQENNLENGEVVGGYYNYNKTIKYNNCISERDANLAGMENTTKYHEILKDDPAYKYYVYDKHNNYLNDIKNQDIKDIENDYRNACEKCCEKGDMQKSEKDEFIKNNVNDIDQSSIHQKTYEMDKQLERCDMDCNNTNEESQTRDYQQESESQTSNEVKESNEIER